MHDTHLLRSTEQALVAGAIAAVITVLSLSCSAALLLCWHNGSLVGRTERLARRSSRRGDNLQSLETDTDMAATTATARRQLKCAQRVAGQPPSPILLAIAAASTAASKATQSTEATTSCSVHATSCCYQQPLCWWRWWWQQHQHQQQQQERTTSCASRHG